ncbi:hypothetical protein [Brevibacterium moorei]|uniref:hypothetical protein n=1 Tax=Brevibacterium moorei TaxID=2968457 RepID=UPI00211CA628|nr:hypothetical protein [Brevibacterium sp. 68QC2CO]MCQ9385595.1 hypothetical protein [Brevibacterium sp. 68QC2CO]
MEFFGRRLAISVGLAAALAMGGLIPAQAIGVEEQSTGSVTRSTTTVVNEQCADQVREINEELGDPVADGIEVCDAKIETTSTTGVVTDAEIDAAAAVGELTIPEATALKAKKKKKPIYKRSWDNGYLSGVVYERHTGTTYYDGSKAWIKKYRGKTGKHTCHAQGSWAVGWVVTPLSCGKPKAGKTADAVHKFDTALVFKGSPIRLTVGLHLRVSNKGEPKAWQVGG